MSGPDVDLKQFPVLVVDDEPDNLSAFRFNFRKVFDVTTAESGEEALALLDKLDPAVIVTDQRMPGLSGTEFLKKAAALRPDALGVILTAFTDVDVLIEAVSLGQVQRYITKPWDAREVKAVLRQCMERFYLRRENKRLGEQLRQYAGYLDYQAHSAFDFGVIIGEAPSLKELLDRVEQVAPTQSTVLLRGETGTGKELVARAVHINSERAEKPFVAINCAALPSELLESELFGHEKGSFTNAIAQRKGRFELADGGTLFLDEVGDLPMEVQIKLLRVLQEREFDRVGGTGPVRVDVRVISATNRDLETMVETGEFREDLYYRLNVFPLRLPPLRERVEDISLLASHFVLGFVEANRRGPKGISDEAIRVLGDYAWPGNVRELQNVIERACIIAKQPMIGADDIDFGPRALAASSPRTDAPTTAAPLKQALLDQEKSAIASAVQESNGNIAAAARTLGINRSTLYFRIKKFGLEHLLPTRP